MDTAGDLALERAAGTGSWNGRPDLPSEAAAQRRARSVVSPAAALRRPAGSTAPGADAPAAGRHGPPSARGGSGSVGQGGHAEKEVTEGMPHYAKSPGGGGDKLWNVTNPLRKTGYFPARDEATSTGPVTQPTAPLGVCVSLSRGCQDKLRGGDPGERDQGHQQPSSQLGPTDSGLCS